MNKKIILIGSVAAACIVVLFFAFNVSNQDKLVTLNITSLFTIKSPDGSYTIRNGEKIWSNVIFEPKIENKDLYETLKPSDGVIVIYPVFTAAAYEPGGFYDYYGGHCNASCLTQKLKDSYAPRFETSGNAVQALSLLGYKFVSDVDISENPGILTNYDKVIVLHNEYVTKTEFNAITSHQNVIYLYPNALYAEVSYDPQSNQITLVRGHNYPDSNILNGFGWQYDNSDKEYNTDCSKMRFDKVGNGWMLNCYPETPIHASKVLLQTIKDLH
ncbi:MAG TPA: hypothetical protein VFM64_02955 [Candidatus Nitrosotenuis sp.]|nr:hypothetical protein [Candidatus Nitrosotenuis sp.]